MDRQAKLSRLRFLLVELTEQLKSDTLDPSDHKQAIFLMGEINKLCNELGLLEVSLIETDWTHGGRVTLHHPGMTFSAPFQSDFHVTKRIPFGQAMRSAMRRPEVFPILQEWMRWVDHQASRDASNENRPEQLPEGPLSGHQQPPAELLSELTPKLAEVLRLVHKSGSLTWDEVMRQGWPEADGGASEDNARRTVDRLVTWLSDHGWPVLVEVKNKQVRWIGQK